MNQYAGPAPEARHHAFRDDALGDHDATALADLLRRGERSAAELTDAAMERIQAVNPALNGLALDTFQTARQGAGQCQQGGGEFAGVPSLIKDNIDVAGLPTGHGASAVRPRNAAKISMWPACPPATGPAPCGHATRPSTATSRASIWTRGSC